MNQTGRALLLVGSAKRPQSTSESLGTYLLEQLRARGFETQTLLLHRAFKSDETVAALLAATDRADVLVLAFPLYVDSLPYLATRALECIAEHRQGQGERKEQRLLAIANSGFPEAQHNETALAICRRFAQKTGFMWAGGLALGGGEAIGGRPLPEAKGMARNVIKSLDLAADALARGRPVSQEAQKQMAKSILPRWIYTRLASWGWKRQAKKHGAGKKLHDQPYSSGTDAPLD